MSENEDCNDSNDRKTGPNLTLEPPCTVHKSVGGVTGPGAPGETEKRVRFNREAEEEMENLSSVSPLSAFLALKSHSLRLDSKSVENNREPGGV